ncbi:cell cycle checkpoint protein Rad17 [Aspergillus ellipticus CBS 707.79]|uniref:Cell cycle checkpoint protein Rad17 n=1 Tax=Aspergillus ellipticus CBS 707.79 TaxID=1448320 RepID=A0A319D8Y4_9EURO|nr:cell cycle checkpoint protein Rad17 [Aspergillus ellipticus CBS 707.79]
MKRKYPQSARNEETSLHSFFGPTTSKQQPSFQYMDSRRDLSQNDTTFDNDDIVDDGYDSFDEIFTQHILSDKATLQQGSEIPNLHNQISLPQKSLYCDQRSDLNKRFSMPQPLHSRPQQSRYLLSHEQNLPWAQQFPPSNLDELAVHKKKVSDVKNWLMNAFAGSDRQLLVLRGPAGSGKTSTISLLSSVLGFGILEWKNPSTFESVTKTHVSTATRFEEFVARGNEFNSLDLDGVTSSLGIGDDDGITSTPKRHIMLVEEYPTLTGQPANLAAFRLSLQRYLAITTPEEAQMESSKRPSSPIVIIVSETLLDSRSFQSDNLTVHRLLGPELYNHPRSGMIDFNGIAPTIMYRALNLVLEKEASISGREKLPSSAILHSISRMGDIRSAVSSLEFLCLRCEDFVPAGASVSATKPKRARTTLTSPEKETLELVTQRGASLGLFHAVGKVVYNKRADVVSATGSRPVLPPDHLSYHKRPQSSQVCVNELVDEAGTDAQTLISTIHENYAPSCNGSLFTEYLDGCISALSDSDVLGSHINRQTRTWGGINSTEVDLLRQTDISYQVAVRGILFALPHPVNRSSISKEGLNNTRSTYKMFFPDSLRLIRDMEEIQGLIGLWSCKLFDQSSEPFVSSMIDASGYLSQENNRGQNSVDPVNHCIDPKVVLTITSRSDLILHQLPYLALLTSNIGSSKELKKITEMSRFEAQDNAMDRSYSNYSELPSMTSGIEQIGHPSKSFTITARQQTNNSGSQIPLAPGRGRLILIDDDIIDDF